MRGNWNAKASGKTSPSESGEGVVVTTKGLRRRRFLGAAAPFFIFPRYVLGGKAVPPSDRLAVAGIGLGAIGAENLSACETERIVALCDVDWSMAHVQFKKYPGARRCRDFRRLLDREKGLDAVVVATPDHTHAVIAASAMKRGLHVYLQMPLAHDVWEVRELTRLARTTKVATQMGNERYSGPTIRRVCEWLWDGCIGSVHRVHCWTNRPQWPQGLVRPTETPPVPSSLSWDLWLGPAPERPYHPAYHPYRWRGWRPFGTGALGAIGCHVMDGAYWALRLAEAQHFTVEAESTGGTPESYPRSSIVRYRFPARGTMPPVTLVWYEGGRLPPRPPELPATRRFVGSNGTIFEGEKGKLIFGAVTAGTHPGQAGPRFLPESLGWSYKPPPKTIPRVPSRGRWVKAHRHVQEWIRACKGGPPACSRFEAAGPLTEIVLLGVLAQVTRKPITYNRTTMTVTSNPQAQALLRRPYRKGWSL